MQQPNSSYEDFGKLACELDQKLDNWNKAVLSHDSSTISNADKALVTCVNEIASLFGVVGGAFAVANYEKNSYQLIRQYDLVDQGMFLFPYIENNTSSLLDQVKECTDYSTWMHSLFAIQRDDQRLTADNKLEAEYVSMKLPEYYRHFSSSNGDAKNIILLIPHEIILKAIQRWVDVWELASINSLGLAALHKQAIIDYNNGLLPHNDTASILDCINKAFDDTPPIFTAAHNYFPEKLFFFDGSSSNDLILACRLIGSLTVARIRTTLGINRNYEDLIYEQDPDNASLLLILTALHESALFPIIPYLFLNLLDNRNLSHCVLPLMRTTEFPLKVSFDNSDDGVLNPCYMSMLCTVAEADTQKTDEEVQNQKLRLFSLSMLMRLGAEPIADNKFYGGIQRRNIQSESSRNAFLNYFHSITHEIGPLQSRLLKSWLRPLNDISPSICSIGTTDAEGLCVVTIPRTYSMVADIFSLWTSKGWLERMGISSTRPFLEVLDILLICAANSQTVANTARTIPDSDLNSITESKAWERALEKISKRAESICIINNRQGLENLIWDPEYLDDTATNFCRLIVAITANSLKHYTSGHITTCLSYDADSNMLKYSQTNPVKAKPTKATEAYELKKGGTLVVINFLVYLLNGKSSVVRFEFDEDIECWKTEFFIPAPFLRV